MSTENEVFTRRGSGDIVPRGAVQDQEQDLDPGTLTPPWDSWRPVLYGYLEPAP